MIVLLIIPFNVVFFEQYYVSWSPRVIKMIIFLMRAAMFTLLAAVLNCGPIVMQDHLKKLFEIGPTQKLFTGSVNIGKSSYILLNGAMKGKVALNGTAYSMKNDGNFLRVDDISTLTSFENEVFYHHLDIVRKTRNEVTMDFTQAETEFTQRIDATGVVICLARLTQQIDKYNVVMVIAETALKTLNCNNGGINGTIVSYSPMLIQFVYYVVSTSNLSQLNTTLTKQYEQLKLIRTYVYLIDCEGCLACNGTTEIVCLNCEPKVAQSNKNMGTTKQLGKTTKPRKFNETLRILTRPPETCKRTPQTIVLNCSQECLMCREGWCTLCQNRTDIILDRQAGICEKVFFRQGDRVIQVFATNKPESYLKLALDDNCKFQQLNQTRKKVKRNTSLTGFEFKYNIPAEFDPMLDCEFICDINNDYFSGYLNFTVQKQEPSITKTFNSNINNGSVDLNKTEEKTNSTSNPPERADEIPNISSSLNVQPTEQNQQINNANQSSSLESSNQPKPQQLEETLSQLTQIGSDSNSSKAVTQFDPPQLTEFDQLKQLVSAAASHVQPNDLQGSNSQPNVSVTSNATNVTGKKSSSLKKNEERNVQNSKVLNLYQHNLETGTPDAKLTNELNQTYGILLNEDLSSGKIISIFRLLNFWTLFTNVPYWLSYQQLLPWPQIFHLQQIEKMLTLWVFTGSYFTLFPSKPQKPSLLFFDFPDLDIQDEDMDINFKSLGFSSYFLFSNLTQILSIIFMLILSLIVKLVIKKSPYIPLDNNRNLQELFGSQTLNSTQKVFIQGMFAKEFQSANRFVETLFLRVLDKSFHLSLINMVLMHQYPPFQIGSHVVAYISFGIAYVFWIIYLYKQYFLLKEIRAAISIQTIIKASHNRQLELYNQKLRIAYSFSLGDLHLGDTINPYYHFISLVKKILMALIITLGPESSQQRESFLLVITVLFSGFLLNLKPYLLKIKLIFFCVINMFMVALLLTKCFAQHNLITFLNFYSSDADRLDEIIKIGWVIIAFELLIVSISMIYTLIYYTLQLMLCIKKRQKGNNI